MFRIWEFYGSYGDPQNIYLARLRIIRNRLELVGLSAGSWKKKPSTASEKNPHRWSHATTDTYASYIEVRDCLEPDFIWFIADFTNKKKQTALFSSSKFLQMGLYRQNSSNLFLSEQNRPLAESEPASVCESNAEMYMTLCVFLHMSNYYLLRTIP